jgi:hypothetical protein
MPDIKSQIKYKVFLGIIFLLGGVISILVPASKLDGSSIATIIMGIIFVMLGDMYFWEAIEGLRKRKKEKQEIKDIQGK